MTVIHRFKIDKLVRDKAPVIMTEWGGTLCWRIMDKAEYIEKLKKKLLEEAREVLLSKNNEELVEEMADVFEVMHCLIQANNLTVEQIEAKRVDKKTRRGGFDDKIYMDWSEFSDDNPHINYYLNKPQEYPEVTAGPAE